MRWGSLFLNNRYHDPVLGVFISVDPLVATTGEAYISAGGNPTTLSDPLGLDPYWAQDQDPCNDNGYYKCGTAKAGPDVGKKKPHAYGDRTRDEFDRGIGIDPARWCHVTGSSFSSGCGGAPPQSAEYDRLGEVLAVLGYLSKFGGPLGDGAAGFADGAVVSAGAHIGKNGRYTVFWQYYRLGLDDFGGMLGPADNLVVRTRWVGRSFVALQAGVTAFESWRASEGHSMTYRFSYTAVKTAAVTGGAMATAYGGTKLGVAVGCWAGPWGCAIGGAVGGIGGGIGGAILADKVTDAVWDFTYEELAG